MLLRFSLVTVSNQLEGAVAACAEQTSGKTAVGLGKAAVQDVCVEDDGRLMVAVAPAARELERCPYCRRRCPG